MWEIDYTEEVKFYFIDNGDLVFDLLVSIEELKFIGDGIPPEGCIEIRYKKQRVKRHAAVHNP